MPNFVKTWRQRNLAIYALMFLIGIILLIIAHYCTKDSLQYFLFKETGFALIVAIFLVFTIEKFTREHHQVAADELIEKTHKNLFHAIYKRYIPEKIFEEVEKAVMESDVVRSGYELDYTIEQHPTRSDLVSCTAQSSYVLESVIDAPIEHKIVIQLELPIEKQFHKDCSIDELSIDGNPVAPDVIRKSIVRDSDYCTLTHEFKVNARGKHTISSKSRLIKKSTDMEVWASRIPSDGLQLTVSTPNKSLSVSATAKHSQKLEVKLNNDVTKKWNLPYGIFPYQSIIFWWTPKPNGTVSDVASGAPAGAADAPRTS